MHTSSLTSPGLLFLLLMPPLAAHAVDGLPRIDSAPVRVALFKNGLGFVERRATIPQGVIEGELGELPPPIHGTFWVNPLTPGVDLRHVVARTVTREPVAVERDVAGIAELLQANDGRVLELVVVGADGKLELLEGRLRILNPALVSTPSPDVPTHVAGRDPFAHPAPARVSPPPQPPAPSGGLLLLETAHGQRVFEQSAVRQVRGQNLELRRTIQQPQVARPSLALRVSNNEQGVDLALSYLARGITWAPSYRLELADDTTLRLQAKAQIINDLEDLDGVRISVIAGFPNLQFAHVVDPLAFRGDMAGWLNSLAPPRHPGMPREQVTRQQVVMMNVAMQDDQGMGVSFDPSAFAERGDADLFFYDLPDVHLRRGDRAYYPLFTADVPYESVYECRIDPAQQDTGQRGEAFAVDVWHALRLDNTTPQPWTTAPAIVTRDGLILGQDTLYFTSLGGRTLLRFTKALDVRASSLEQERTRERVPYRGSHWDLVTAEETIRLANLKPVAVTVLVRRTVVGDIVENPQEADLSLVQAGITAVNPTTNLAWEVRIPPRQTAELAYTYKRYVR